MPTQHTVTTTVFQFDELSDKAKEKAREWFREGNLEDSWWYESVYEDAERMAKILGIEFDTKPVPLMGGGTRHKPVIYFSGFWSQGDGACFEGSYAYAKNSAKAIRKEAPAGDDPKSLNPRLHNIADSLAAVQKKNNYKLEARVKHSGHYYHEHCTRIEVFRSDEKDVSSEDEETVADALREFMRWIYRSLEAECEYRNSDETVDEDIRANEYEFTEDGRRYCG